MSNEEREKMLKDMALMRKEENKKELKHKRELEEKRLKTIDPNLKQSPQYYNIAELKDFLKLRGLTRTGNKAELVERLENYEEKNGYSGWPKMKETARVKAEIFAKMMAR